LLYQNPLHRGDVSLDDARLRCCRLKRCDLRGTQLPEQHGAPSSRNADLSEENG